MVQKHAFHLVVNIPVNTNARIEHADSANASITFMIIPQIIMVSHPTSIPGSQACLKLHSYATELRVMRVIIEISTLPRVC